MLRLMLSCLAGLFLSLAARSASHACGVKLGIKAPGAERRTSTPSSIALYESPKEALMQRVLERYGHDVDVAKDVDDLKAKAFKIVFSHPDRVGELKSRAPQLIVLPASPDIRSNLRMLERVLREQKRREAASKTAPST